MTLIKNSIKLLIGIFAVVCVASTQKAGALSFSDYFELPANACLTSTFSETQLIYQSAGVFSNSNASSTWSNYPSFVVSNSAPNYRFNSPCSYQGSRPGGVSFLKPTKSTDFMTIGLYNYQGGYKDVVLPKSGYLHTMKNGESVNFDNIYLGHGFIVLYTSDYSHTLQFFSDYYLEDYILFTDPLQSSLTNSSVDNFFLISYPQKKAWSFKLLEMHIDSLFKGNLGDYKVNTFPFTKSYTLTPNLGASPFPTFSSYMSASVSNWHNINGERFYNDTGFIYSEDFEFQAPNFGGDTNDNNTNIHSPTYNTEVINNYNYCVNKGENLRKGLQLAVMCKNQGEDLRENIIIDTGLNYTGNYSYCLQLDNFIVNAYQTYSGNWNNGLINDNVNLQYNAAPFNDLLFSRYYNSIVIDENHNITGLPNGNNWCAALTIGDAYEDQKSYIEKVADSLTDFFGTGVAKDYIDSVNEHSSFSGLITSIKNGTYDYFDNYFFDPFETQFNSGYNAFNSKFGFESCQDIQSEWGFLQIGDYIVYICAGLIIFIFLLCL